MQRGFTLVEILVALGILVALTGVLFGFERYVFSENRVLQSSLFANQDARTVLRMFTAELRAAQPAATGAYPIAVAGPLALTFYTDLNKDGVVDQVRYFATGTSVKKGMIIPSGSPLSYDPAAETISTVASGLVPGTTAIFNYYDKNYAGTSSPLAVPVSIPAIRLVQISLPIDADPTAPPVAETYQTEVTVRSLKDNL